MNSYTTLYTDPGMSATLNSKKRATTSYKSRLRKVVTQKSNLELVTVSK